MLYLSYINLNLFAVEQLRQVGVGEHRLREVVVGLEEGSLLPIAEECIQLADCRLGPNAEPTNVAARCQTSQVQLLMDTKGESLKKIFYQILVLLIL